MRRDLGRARCSQWEISSRTSTMAVNIEIRMPMLMVMAKPRMAPVPIANRISILISVVAFASTIVR